MKAAAFLTACLGLVFSVSATRVRGSDAAIGKQAESIFAATGVQGGLVVHLGCGDGRLTAALRKNQAFVVHGMQRQGQGAAFRPPARLRRRHRLRVWPGGGSLVERVRGRTVPPLRAAARSGQAALVQAGPHPYPSHAAGRRHP